MANRCVGLDLTWAHLPTPAPTHTAHAAASHYYCFSPAWLTSAAAAFENEALTSALRASMTPAPAHAYSAAASSFSSPATPSSSTSSTSELLSSSGHDAPAPASRPGQPPARARALAGPRGGRVTKRKPRPSRRPQTTYITADPANFRRMVQEITGLPGPSPLAAASEAPAPAYVLPTLDTSAFLLDRAAAVLAPEDKSPGAGGHASTSTDAVAVAAAAGDDDSSAALLELEALVRAAAGECGFPTLDSWGSSDEWA